VPSTVGVVASSHLFSPLDLSPALWLDAADTSTITASGSPLKVSQWNDKSGNGRHVSQSSGGAQPQTGVHTLNSRNVVTFPEETGMTRSTPWTLTEYTVFYVFVPTVLTSLGFIIGGSVRFGGFFGVRPTLKIQDSVFFFNVQSADSTVTMNQAALVTHSAKSNNQAIRYNRTTVATATQATAAGTINGLFVGCQQNTFPGNSTGGKRIAEYIVYDTVLSDTNRDLVESYLATRWGL
jgi:hypothetical protein